MFRNNLKSKNERGDYMYKVKVAKYKKGFDKYVLVNEKFEIYEPVLLYSNILRAKYTIGTIYDYLLIISKFLNYLEGKNMTFDMVIEDTIVNYINYLRGYEEESVIPLESKLSNGTINTHLSVLSKFYQTLDEYETLNCGTPFSFVETFNPEGIYKSFLYHAKINKRIVRKHKLAVNVKHRKNINETRTRKTFDEIKKFRSVINDERDKLLFDLLYNTGARIGEILNLKISDYSEPGYDGWGYIIILERDLSAYDNLYQARNRQAKTGERDVVVLNALIEEIDRYVTEVRPYLENEEFIFVSTKGNKGEPITRGAVEQKFRKYSALSGVKITPHTLRHTHITELSEAGFDDLFIGLRVGHSTARSTRGYQHPSLEAQAEVFKRFGERRFEDDEK